MVARSTVAVVQDGARLHYAIPIALHKKGMLERVFCSWYSAPRSASRFVAHLVKLVREDTGRRMLGRHAPQLQGARVITDPWLEWQVRRGASRFPSFRLHQHWASAMEAKRIRRVGFGRAKGLFGFIRSIDPDLFRYAQELGLRTVGDQIIAPYAVEVVEDVIQLQRFPEWATQAPHSENAEWQEYEQRTWNALDHISCASDYVRDGLLAAGIAKERISVIPYPVDIHDFPLYQRTSRKSPLKIGFLGGLTLRKGFPYFAAMARRIDPARAHFVAVGAVHVTAEQLKATPNLTVVGSVPRSEIKKHLESFDLFYFPTTCEGSAGAVTEAMATGLPVVTSPNSGTVARHGIEGFICPYDDLDTTQQHLEKLLADSDLRLGMGQRARERIAGLSLDQYADAFQDLWMRVFADKTN